ncbi:hypothetical protein QTP88_000280 [Uroleucon formosanum]
MDILCTWTVIDSNDVPRRPEPFFWTTEAWFKIIVFYLLLFEGLGTCYLQMWLGTAPCRPDAKLFNHVLHKKTKLPYIVPYLLIFVVDIF